jgi:hypothetical protein
MTRQRQRDRTNGLRRDAAEMLAIAALAYLAADPEQLGRFLATTGIGPEGIRAAARDPGFLAGVLDHVSDDEALLLAFARDHGLDPAEIGRARTTLGGISETDHS